MSMPLPGLQAQLKMTSIRSDRLDPHFKIPPDARPSAVLILLFPVSGAPHLVFIRRPEYGGVHSGQISFPGGKAEPSDRSSSATALRESWEETGVTIEKIVLLGALSQLYIPPSRFLVTPHVAYMTERPSFTRDPKEVEEILELPLDEFYNPENFREVSIKVRDDQIVRVPAYIIREQVIWGATAMMMSEFLEIARD